MYFMALIKLSNKKPEKFYSISELGSISILGVSIGTSEEEALERLKPYNVNKNIFSLRVDNFVIANNLPPVRISYLLDKACLKINSIRIYATCKAEQSYRTYRYLKGLFSDLDVYAIDKKKGCITESEYGNILHNIKIFVQQGIGEDDTLCPFLANIYGKLLSDSDGQKRLNEDIYKLYTNKMQLSKKSVLKNSFWRTTSKIILFIAVLIIAYLFALNGRYMQEDSEVYFDKWKCKLILVEYGPN